MKPILLLPLALAATWALALPIDIPAVPGTAETTSDPTDDQVQLQAGRHDSFTSAMNRAKERRMADFPTGYGYDADAHTDSDTNFLRRALKAKKSASDPAEDFAAWGPDFPDADSGAYGIPQKRSQGQPPSGIVDAVVVEELDETNWGKRVAIVSREVHKDEKSLD